MMMMKGMMIHQAPPNQTAVDNNNQENLSNVTSAASGEASCVSSSNGGIFPQHYFASSDNPINQPEPQQQQQIKKRRNQPGNPDPDSEVIALSPKTLLATNRFVCEICNKGFQRDQNLQLHRRGHNLPWKLKQRNKNEVVRRKVYVCPEPSCVHHEPSRALGDLTGIKKHFCRKHGEKKWKCEKCSKRYAVQSDWKAHSKTCGTREYRCDCGTLFSRRDSFITHRAFCDALAEESSRAITTGNAPPSLHFQPPPQFGGGHDFSVAAASYSIKKEHPHGNGGGIAGFHLRPEIPPWLLPCPAGPPPPQQMDMMSSPVFQEFQNHSGPPTFPASYDPSSSPHVSATALLQKAAQMGSTMSGGKSSGSAGPTVLFTGVGAHTGNHVSTNADEPAADFGLNLSSRDYNNSNPGYATVSSGAPSPNGGPAGSFLHHMININSFSSPPFDDPLFGCFKDGGCGGGDGGGGGGSEDVTKDFLGLRPLSRSDIFSITGLVNTTITTADHHHDQSQSKKTWQQT